MPPSGHRFAPPHGLPNIRPVENREQAAVTTRPSGPERRPDPGRVARDAVDGARRLAAGRPAGPGAHRQGPDADRQRARDDLSAAIVRRSSTTTRPAPSGRPSRAPTRSRSQLAWPDPFADQPQAIYENVPLAAQILHRVRTSVAVPVLAKLGAFRPRASCTRPPPSWRRGSSGFVLVHGFPRRVVDEAATRRSRATGASVPTSSVR